MVRMPRSAATLLILLALAAPALAAPETAAPRPGLVRRVWNKIIPARTVQPQLQAPRETQAAAKGGDHRLGLRETFCKIREEFQVYRGDRLEKLGNFFAVGRSRFDASRSVADNLLLAAEKAKLPHYLAEVEGRQVLHVVVDLAKGKETARAVRAVLGQVGKQTIELNYKAASSKNPYGHVAVRAGDGALFDLTGTRGMAELPRPIAKVLGKLRGSSDLSLARRRSLRRFMESRKDVPEASASVFYGMLFAASPAEIKQTNDIYRKRQGTMKAFSVNGGDASQGVYSCAQFLTEEVPFLNERGIGRNIGAKSTASAARQSPKIEAVVVYKMPSLATDQLRFP